MKRTILILPLAALLLAACAATTKQASWTNPENAGHKVKSVFIIGAAKNDFNRRLFEDELARQLAAKGVKGVTSYQHMNLDTLGDKNATTAKVKSLGAESVIIAKVVGQRTDTVVNPGRTYVSGGSPYYPSHYRDHWHDYYRQSYSVVNQPATVTNFQVFTVETNLYGTDKGMIWSMQSDTIAGGQLEATIREFVGIVVKDLAANGLI
ncbi:MAG: hypothetical protein GWP66_07750 [Gammaproteobacteria bacterium]|jgi:hypothetical protein|nr:hypothetical protein [Gammaproteobacteria bacterium]